MWPTNNVPAPFIARARTSSSRFALPLSLRGERNEGRAADGCAVEDTDEFELNRNFLGELSNEHYARLSFQPLGPGQPEV